MTYKTKVLAAAATEPVTLAEAKAQLRIEASFTLDDTFIEALISSARDSAEKYCNRYFTEQEVAIVYDQVGLEYIKLPFPDLASVDEISYINDGVQTVLNPSDYTFYSDLQLIEAADTFPEADLGYTVKVTTAAPLEMSTVKSAILMIIADLYELRTESVVGMSVASNPAVKFLLQPYRVNIGL